MTDKQDKSFHFSDKNVVWISKIMHETGSTIEDVVNSLVSRGIDSLNSEKSEKEKPQTVVRSLGFIDAVMLYKSERTPDPIEYEIQIKEVYRKEGFYYIKATKKGDLAEKSYRLDQIENLIIGGVTINDPLNFFLSGESFNDLNL